MNKTIIKTSILALLLLFSTGAMAQGILGDSVAALTAEQLKSVQADIAEAKAAYPDHFQAVANLVDEAADLDQRKRGRLAPFSAMFKRLGPSAHMALVELLMINGPSQGALKDDAWFALRAGIIEASGRSRDVRLIPVLSAYMNGPETEFYAIRAAAEALGRVGTDEAAQALLNAAETHPLKKGAIVSAMGLCRRGVVAEYLAKELQQSPTDEMADLLIQSLGDVGNAYAWKTAPVKRFSHEEERVRGVAGKALYEHYLLAPEGVLRDRSLKGLVVVNHKETRSWMDASRLQKGPQVLEALDRLESRLR